MIFYVRRLKLFQQNWTEPRPQSEIFASTPIYLLVSAYTFSSSEEFAYSFQSLQRAIIIGQETGGGAHPTEKNIIGKGFVANIPFARAINPATKTNWEGTGVKPDIPVDATDALELQYLIFISMRSIVQLTALQLRMPNGCILFTKPRLTLTKCPLMNLKSLPGTMMVIE